MLKTHIYLITTAVLLTVFVGLVVIHPLLPSVHDQRRDVSRELVRELGLTDLCLFTEARYTRHITQADLFSAFQDHPFSIEHFPSGSILPPPRHLTEPPGGTADHALDPAQP